MAANKYLARENGVTLQKTPATEGGAGSANAIAAFNDQGYFNMSTLPPGVGANVNVIVASEALSAGDFINIHDDNSVAKVRKADNSNGYVAHGYVNDAVSSGANATVYPLDSTNAKLTGLSPGKPYWLGNAGKTISTALDESDVANAGKISQMLGIAVSATELRTDDYGHVVL